METDDSPALRSAFRKQSMPSIRRKKAVVRRKRPAPASGSKGFKQPPARDGMTPENFVYWLQGFLELTDPMNFNEEQIKVIKDHIALVLGKETPMRDVNPIRKLAEELKKPPFVHRHTVSPCGGLRLC